MGAQVVSFHCVLRDVQGKVLGSIFKRETVNRAAWQTSGQNSGPATGRSARRGGQGAGLRGLMARLQNVREGERRTFKLSAREAYGVYDPSLVVEVPRATLDNGFWLRVGSEVPGRLKPSGPRRVFRVTHADADRVVLDANHPFAGQDLVCEVEIVSVRLARREDFGAGGRALH